MTELRIRGRIAWIFAEADFDADRIIGPEHLAESDPDRLAKLAMRMFDPNFADHVQPGDVLVANHNFGYGHPHYPPMQAMRHLGISAVIAESFAPGYWREEMEEGFPQITCPGILTVARRFTMVEIDMREGLVQLPEDGISLRMTAFSPGELALIEAGGLSPLLLAKRGISARGS